MKFPTQFPSRKNPWGELCQGYHAAAVGEVHREVSNIWDPTAAAESFTTLAQAAEIKQQNTVSIGRELVCLAEGCVRTP